MRGQSQASEIWIPSDTDLLSWPTALQRAEADTPHADFAPTHLWDPSPFLDFLFLLSNTENYKYPPYIAGTLTSLSSFFLSFSKRGTGKFYDCWTLVFADQAWAVKKVKLSCCKLVFPHGERKVCLLFDVILCIFFYTHYGWIEIRFIFLLNLISLVPPVILESCNVSYHSL